MRHYRAISTTRQPGSQLATPMRRLCVIYRSAQLIGCPQRLAAKNSLNPVSSQRNLCWSRVRVFVEPTFIQLLIKNGYVVNDKTQQSGKKAHIERVESDSDDDYIWASTGREKWYFLSFSSIIIITALLFEFWSCLRYDRLRRLHRQFDPNQWFFLQQGLVNHSGHPLIHELRQRWNAVLVPLSHRPQLGSVCWVLLQEVLLLLQAGEWVLALGLFHLFLLEVRHRGVDSVVLLSQSEVGRRILDLLRQARLSLLRLQYLVKILD